MAKKKVLVIGGGFGGVFAAKALEKQGRGKLEVELVNANNYFVFQPLLPEVAASSIHSADAVVPLRQLLTRLQVRQAEVMGIDFAEKKVIVVQGARRVPVDLHYDEIVSRSLKTAILIMCNANDILFIYPFHLRTQFLRQNVADSRFKNVRSNSLP